MDRLEKLAREISEVRKLAFRAATQPRLPFSSIDEGALQVKDATGGVRQVIGQQGDGSYSTVIADEDGVVRQVSGQQADGTYTNIDLNAPAPPRPYTAVVDDSRPGLLTITGYGITEDGSAWPLDLARIEVHVSTAGPDFTPTVATKMADWAGADGGGASTLALDEGTYYVRLVAVNTSGVPSLPSVHGVGDVTAAALGASGKPSYSSPEEPTGLDASDDGAIWFDSDNGNTQNRWSGTLLDWVPVLAGPQALTVDALAGKVVPLENTMSMAWGVPDPSAGVSSVDTPGPADVTRLPTYGQFVNYTNDYRGLIRHEGGWWFMFKTRYVRVGGYLSSRFYTPIRVNDDGTIVELGPEISNMQDSDIDGNNRPKFGGVTRVGSTWYVLRYDYASVYGDPYPFWIDRYDDSWTLLGTTSLGPLAANAATGYSVANGAIGTDGTNVLICFVDANRKIVTQLRNPTTLAVTSSTTSTSPVPSGPYSIAAGDQSNRCYVFGVTRGSFDFGSSRTIVSVGDGSYTQYGGQAMGMVLDSSGVNQTAEVWDNMAINGTPPVWADGLFWRNGGGVIQKFTSNKTDVDAWITYTYADTDPTEGTHESASAPPVALVIPKRNYARFSAPFMNVAESTNAPDQINYYVAPRGGSAPARTDFKRLTSAISMPQLFWPTPMIWVPADFSGTTSPPATTTFPVGESGAIVSDEGGFIVRGDGTGDWPYLRNSIVNSIPEGVAHNHSHFLSSLPDVDVEDAFIGSLLGLDADGKWHAVGASSTGVSPTGAVIMTAAPSAPDGFLLCDGSAVSRSTYAALFNSIGTTYGAGDGSTTFNVPNLKGKIPVGLDSTQTEFDALGESGGAKAVTLSINEMPAHTHPGLPKVDATNLTWKTNTIGTGAGGTWNTAASGSSANNFSVASQGGGAAHNNLQPYLVMNYIIKT